MANLNSNILYVEKEIHLENESIHLENERGKISEEVKVLVVAKTKPSKRFAGRISKESADDLQRQLKSSRKSWRN